MIGLGAALLALVLIGIWPPTQGQFKSTVEKSVQDALSSAGTARLVGQAALRGDTLGPYESTALGDASEAVATALSEVAESRLPDADARTLRDEVLPLLQESVRLVGDLDAGIDGDDRALAGAAVDGLVAVQDGLAAVLEGLR